MSLCCPHFSQKLVHQFWWNFAGSLDMALALRVVKKKKSLFESSTHKIWKWDAIQQKFVNSQETSKAVVEEITDKFILLLDSGHLKRIDKQTHSLKRDIFFAFWSVLPGQNMDIFGNDFRIMTS